MGFLDDLINIGGGFLGGGFINGPQFLPGPEPLPRTDVEPTFGGFRPGFDVGDVIETIGRLVRRQDPLDGFPAPGDERLDRLPEVGAGPPALNGGGGTQLRTTGARTAMHIGGNCPGLWHTTPFRSIFSKSTGEFLRQVGGNRVANRVSLVQDDSGALEFVSPVKATWSLKYKTRRHHYHHRRAPAKHHHHRRARRKTGHRHSLTRKQLAAGFGGKSHMKAHR